MGTHRDPVRVHDYAAVAKLEVRLVATCRSWVVCALQCSAVCASDRVEAYLALGSEIGVILVSRWGVQTRANPLTRRSWSFGIRWCISGLDTAHGVQLGPPTCVILHYQTGLPTTSAAPPAPRSPVGGEAGTACAAPSVGSWLARSATGPRCAHHVTADRGLGRQALFAARSEQERQRRRIRWQRATPNRFRENAQSRERVDVPRVRSRLRCALPRLPRAQSPRATRRLTTR